MIFLCIHAVSFCWSPITGVWASHIMLIFSLNILSPVNFNFKNCKFSYSISWKFYSIFLHFFPYPKNLYWTAPLSYLFSGGTGSTAIILSSDGKIGGRSTGQGTNHWVWFNVHGQAVEGRLFLQTKCQFHYYNKITNKISN